MPISAYHDLIFLKPDSKIKTADWKWLLWKLSRILLSDPFLHEGRGPWMIAPSTGTSSVHEAPHGRMADTHKQLRALKQKGMKPTPTPRDQAKYLVNKQCLPFMPDWDLFKKCWRLCFFTKRKGLAFFQGLHITRCLFWVLNLRSSYEESQLFWSCLENNYSQLSANFIGATVFQITLNNYPNKV